MSSTPSGRNFIAMQNRYDRIVLLVDMDCFYCQVEEKLDPSLEGLPIAVVQYNEWRGGGIIAVNYPARAMGVTRHMRGDEAKEQCPDIKLLKVPSVREKADLSKYREAGKKVANVLQRFTPLLERASVDEAYLDITEAVNKRMKDIDIGSYVIQAQELVNTYAVGHSSIGTYVIEMTSRYVNCITDVQLEMVHNTTDGALRQSDLRLLIGASIASEIRMAVKSETGYDCSAGIAHNKILSKLACGINKPNKQTILPLSQIPDLFDSLPVGKIKGLGGLFGEEVCERLKIRYLGQLLQYNETELKQKFDEKNGSWLYNICRGIDLEAVTPRFSSKSIGCCKKFPGRNNITGLNTLKHWFSELSKEISERLENDTIENNRRAKQMVVSFIQEFDGVDVSSSRSTPLNSCMSDDIARHGLDVLRINTKVFFRTGSETILNNPIKFLGITVGKFETISSDKNKIQAMFANQAARQLKTSQHIANNEMNGNENIEKTITTEAAEKSKPMAIAVSANKNVGNRSFFLNHMHSKTIDSSNSKNRSIKINSDDHEKTESKMDFEIKDNVPVSVASISLIVEENNMTHKIPPDDIGISSKSFFVKALQKKETIKNKYEIDGTDELSNGIEEKGHAMKIDKHVNQVQLNNNVKDDNIKDHNDGDILKLESDMRLIASEYTKDPKEKSNILSSPRKRKFNEMEVNSENINDYENHDNDLSKNNYKTNYAEYAVPELRPEFMQLYKCSTCGAQLQADERVIQTHHDQHFALELSQQQRIEYRTEIQAKFMGDSKKTTLKLSNVKKKIKSINSTNTKSLDITKFLKPKITLETTVTMDDADKMETCKECNIFINRNQMEEHMDYHLAKNLQRTLNQQDIPKFEILKVEKQKESSSNNQKALKKFFTGDRTR